MDRRIRVKCTNCTASIELLVDRQELLDVTCPRCRQVFTATIPPPPPEIIEVAPLEVQSLEEDPAGDSDAAQELEVIEPISETPVVRMTRVVRPEATNTNRSRPTTQSRSSATPRRTVQRQTLPQAPLSPGNWQTPLPHYQPVAPRVSGATHVKAFFIATGGVLAVGLLVMMGFMVKSVIASIDWSSDSSDTFASSTSTTPNSSGSGDANAVGADNATPSINNSSSEPQSNTGGIADKVIEQAKQIADATRRFDYYAIIDRTYPRAVKLAGGRERMHAQLVQAMDGLKTQGISIADYRVSNNVVVREVKRKVFATVATELDLNYQGRILRSGSFLLAVSEDSGRTFTFLDGSGVAKNRQVLKQILPDMPGDLQLPVVSEPREVTP